MQTDAQMLVHKQFLSSIPQIDPNVLNDIEIEAQYLASNLDNLTENLCNLLHSVCFLVFGVVAVAPAVGAIEHEHSIQVNQIDTDLALNDSVSDLFGFLIVTWELDEE